MTVTEGPRRDTTSQADRRIRQFTNWTLFTQRFDYRRKALGNAADF
jgi:hypothetical protein